MMKTLSSTVLVLTLLTGCNSNIAFQGSPSAASDSLATEKPPTDGSDLICQPGQVTVTKPTKFILVVDQSGSNVNGPYEHPGQATDPAKVLRYGAIAEFFLLHGSKSHVSWSFVTFNGTIAHALTNSGSDQSPVFTNFTGMSAALEEFHNKQDVGPTPYLPALQMVRNLIAQDLQVGGGSESQYRIAFLTDGYPTDLPVGQALENAIDVGVSSIVSLAPSAIQFSTVYYGLPDATASPRLQRMATLGQGEFLDVSSTRSLHLGDLIEVPKPSCHAQ